VNVFFRPFLAVEPLKHSPGRVFFGTIPQIAQLSL
jgi:hypothetical protein